jgi:hypothetical protein
LLEKLTLQSKICQGFGVHVVCVPLDSQILRRLFSLTEDTSIVDENVNAILTIVSV